MLPYSYFFAAGAGRNNMNSINRQYKDRLFRAIFGSAERKEYALALYNAVNGTSYENALCLVHIVYCLILIAEIIETDLGDRI